MASLVEFALFSDSSASVLLDALAELTLLKLWLRLVLLTVLVLSTESESTILPIDSELESEILSEER